MNIYKIKKKYIEIKNKDLLPIYYSKKDSFKKSKNKKIIIVIEEIFGVNQNIKEICLRLTKHNYLAIAPELFFRFKNLDFNQNINSLRIKINDLSDLQIISDIEDLIIWVKNKFNTNKIGLTGFCWGGRISWLYSFYKKNINTAVIWYGRLSGEKNNKHPLHPIDIGEKINIPVLGLYGKKDISIPISIVEKMKDKLNNLNQKIIIYPNAGHGFYADYRPSYHKESAEHAWKKMIDWFEKYII